MARLNRLRTLGGLRGRALSAGSSAAYSPLADSPYAWWDAGLSTLYSDTGTTVVTANDATIRQIADLSGNARHGVAPSDAARALLKTNVINGLPALLFDGIDDTFACGSFGISTFACVAVIYNLGTDQIPIGHGSSTLQTQTGPTLSVDRTGGVSTKDNTVSGWADSAFIVACWHYNASHATHLLSVNGVEATLTAGSDGGAAGGTRTADFYLGSNANTNNFLSGYIHAVWLGTPLDTAARDRVIDYYKTRIGVA